MTNDNIRSSQVRGLLASELNGIRRFSHKSKAPRDLIYWMIVTAKTCYSRIDLVSQQNNFFGVLAQDTNRAIADIDR